MRNVIRRVTTMTFTFFLQSPPLPISQKLFRSPPQFSISSLPLATQRFATFSTKSKPNMADSIPISYLTQREATEIDETLMGPLGLTVDQLMVSIFLFFSLKVFIFFPFFPPDLSPFSLLCFRNWLVLASLLQLLR